MQQFNKQVQREFPKLFGGVETSGKPNIYQRIARTEKFYKQIKELINQASDFQVDRINYLKSQNVQGVYETLELFLSNQTKKNGRQ